jgi:glycerate-2-kinase
LLLAPVEGITLNDKQQLTQLLLQSGADINELNCVRKHISAVKGGRLARAFYPAQMLTLILSDVMGDPLEVIASGPTAADSTSFDDAWKVIEKYQLQQKIPPSVLQYLQQGREGQVVDTIKQGDVCLQSVRNVIVGNNFLALEAARKQAIQLGFESKIIKTNLHGEARVAAHWLAQAAREALEKMQAGERCCLLSGGETTVTVTGSGMGGRNQELALAFALEIEGLPGVGLLSAATDGSDGANDAAGGWVHGHTVALAKRFGLEPDEYLSANNSYEFFQQFDVASGEHTHLITDPTGTNVMDVQIMLLEK